MREEEIEHFQRQLEAVSRVLASAQLRLDALRVVVTTESPVHKDCLITQVVMPAAGGFRNIPVSAQDNDGLQ